MAALAKNKNITRLAGDHSSDPVAANVTIFEGAIVCLDASGNAVPGSTSNALTARGVSKQKVDNTNGAAGALEVRSEKGVFNFVNDGTNAVTRAHIGETAYIVDDQTVASTNGGGTRSALGQIVQVSDSGQVGVRIV